MFRWILLFAVVLAGQASAQMYERINYRDDDPFVFCTQGQDPKKYPERCWVPTPPYTGSYMMLPHCKPPNYYNGKDWTQADIDSLKQYLSVCPNAETSGSWDGPGRPESTPTEH